MNDMYYSVTFGFGEYGNLMGILFEEVEVDVENEIELSRKTVKEIKRERQDVNHVNIIEDNTIILKLYYNDNCNTIKKIEGHETHIMSTSKFQSAKYSKTGKIITSESNGSQIIIDIEKETVNEIKKIGKKSRNNKRFNVSSSLLFDDKKTKINPVIVKLISDLSSINYTSNLSFDDGIYCTVTNDNDCKRITLKTKSKEAFKQERDMILKYSEEFLIFLNFGKQEV
jgi:hypothetical protein